MVVENKYEVCLGSFLSKTVVAEKFPGLNLKNARFESAKSEKEAKVVVDSLDFLEYVSQIEKEIGKIRALVISQKSNFERLSGNLSANTPGMFVGDIFVGYYPSREEALEDFELNSLYALYSNIIISSERLENCEGVVIGDKIDVKVAFFATCDEVLHYMKKLSAVIEHNKIYVENREEFLFKLNSLLGG